MLYLCPFKGLFKSFFAILGIAKQDARKSLRTVMYDKWATAALPKNGSRRSYLTAEGTVFSWKDLATGETWQTLDLEHPEDC